MVENVLKPMHVTPPPEDAHFNYIIDIWAKWHQSYFCFGATYARPGPNAISPTFESKFARPEFLGGNKFALSCMRHTGKWFEIFPRLSLDECLDFVRDEPRADIELQIGQRSREQVPRFWFLRELWGADVKPRSGERM